MSDSVERLASMKRAIQNLKVAEAKALLYVYDRWYRRVKGAMDKGTLLKARQELRWIRAAYASDNSKSADYHFRNFNVILEQLEHHIDGQLGGVVKEGRQQEREAKKVQQEALKRQREAAKKQQEASKQAQMAREQQKQARKEKG